MRFSFTVAIAALAASLVLPTFAIPTPDVYNDVEAREYDLNDFVARDEVAGELLMRENSMDNMLVARGDLSPFGRRYSRSNTTPQSTTNSTHT